MQEGFEGQSIFGPNLSGIEVKTAECHFMGQNWSLKLFFFFESLLYVKSHSSIQLVQNVHCTEVLRMLQ